MPGPLLETKLHLPRPRRALVPRPRLDARLDRVLEGLAPGRGSDDTAILGLRWLS